MKAIVAFWKKDIINKLIVLISAALIMGVIATAYLLLTMKSDSMFYAVFALPKDESAIPTLAPVPTAIATETTFVFSTETTIPDAPALDISAPTVAAELTATPTLEIPTATIQAPLPSASPTMSLATSLPTQSSQDAVACIPATPSQTGKVLDVIDGNTIKVLIDGVAYTVRYIGIDVPKYKPVAEYFGQESDFKNAEYVFAKQVTLVSDLQDKDDSGRLLRYVKVGDIFVNFELVRQGFASANAASSACSQVFKLAEQAASQSKTGMWKPTPTLATP